MHLNIEIPGNSTATIYIPAINQAKITEGGKSPDKVSGMEFIELENNIAVYKIGSGTYSFISKDVSSLIQPVMHTSTPVISPKDTLYTKPDKALITIHSATEGAKIYYTTDGSVPSEKSILYSAPFYVRK